MDGVDNAEVEDKKVIITSESFHKQIISPASDLLFLHSLSLHPLQSLHSSYDPLGK